MGDEKLWPKTAFILGAGFSKAISMTMPSTDQLGDQIIRSLSTKQRKELNPPLFSGSKLTFENWLSWLAEKQPYETEREFYAHFSQFLQIQSLIANLIRQQQGTVLEGKIPGWVFNFIQLLHESESTVITLNYDSILENVFDRLYLKNENGGVCTRLDLTKIFPRQQGFTYGNYLTKYSSTKTFNLYKLHGSVDWFWVPEDLTGESLQIVEVDPFETPQEKKAGAAARGGKMEFIVPPTHSKNSYLANAKMRYQWEESYKAIENADHLVIAGYSLPESDAAMASMLSRALSNRKSRISILNLNSAGVSNRVQSLGVDAERIEIYDGSRSIQNFVESEVRILSQETTAVFSNLWKSNRYSPLAVAWDQNCIAGVRDAIVNPKNGELTLIVDGFGNLHSIKRPGDNPAIDLTILPAITYADLLEKTNKLLGVGSIRVKVPWSGYRPIVDFISELPELQKNATQPETDWLILKPLGERPPVIN